MRISVIIPVFREEGIIGEAIDRILNAPDYASVSGEILVSDGDPGHSTLLAVKDKPVRGIGSEKGRGVQMNTAARLASGEILLFLHADTVLPDSAFESIRRALEDPEISGGAFSLRIDSRNPFLKMAAGLTNLRARINRIPYGDQALFIRESVFEEAGGFAPIPLLEDVELMRRLRRSGKKIVILKDAVTTSSRRWEREGMVSTTLRNRLISVLYACGVKPEKLLKLHKVRMI